MCRKYDIKDVDVLTNATSLYESLRDELKEQYEDVKKSYLLIDIFITLIYFLYLAIVIAIQVRDGIAMNAIVGAYIIMLTIICVTMRFIVRKIWIPHYSREHFEELRHLLTEKYVDDISFLRDAAETDVCKNIFYTCKLLQILLDKDVVVSNIELFHDGMLAITYIYNGEVKTYVMGFYTSHIENMSSHLRLKVSKTAVYLDDYEIKCISY